MSRREAPVPFVQIDPRLAESARAHALADELDADGSVHHLIIDLLLLAGRSYPDGCLGTLSAKALARALKWEGDPHRLRDALVASGWLRDSDDGLVIEGWDRWTGKYVESRRKNRERQARWRTKKNSNVTVTETSTRRYGDVYETLRNDNKNCNLNLNVAVATPRAQRATRVDPLKRLGVDDDDTPNRPTDEDRRGVVHDGENYGEARIEALCAGLGWGVCLSPSQRQKLHDGFGDGEKHQFSGSDVREAIALTQQRAPQSPIGYFLGVLGGRRRESASQAVSGPQTGKAMRGSARYGRGTALDPLNGWGVYDPEKPPQGPEDADLTARLREMGEDE